MRVIGNHIRSASAFDQSDIQRARSNLGIAGQSHRPQPSERRQELVNCRVAQLGIRRVCHAPFCSDLNAQGSFRRQRNTILGRLAVDQKSAACGRMIIGDLCSQTVALFSDHKEQSNMNSFAPQPFRCRDLRRDDPLGVTRSAPVNAIRIFGRRNERWNRVHVRGKYDLRIRLARARLRTH